MSGIHDHGRPKKIAIIRSSSIGDVVLASSCLDYIEKINKNNDISVIWIGRAPSIELIRRSFPAMECLDIGEIGLDHIIERLSEVEFLVDLQTNLRTRLLAFKFYWRYGRPTYRCRKNSFGRILMVAMACIKGRRWQVPEFYRSCGKHQYTMMVKTLMGALGDNHVENEYRPRLRVGEELKSPYKEMLGCCQRWLMIAPGAAYEVKKAPIEIVAGVLRELSKYRELNSDVGLVFLGSKEDYERSDMILQQAGWSATALNLCGKTSLWDSASIISRVKAVLSNDSALAHIAEALDIPCVTLFGPTIEAFGFAPWQQASQAFSSTLGCRPCSRHGKAPCRYGDQKCFADLAVNVVANRLASIIAGSR